MQPTEVESGAAVLIESITNTLNTQSGAVTAAISGAGSVSSELSKYSSGSNTIKPPSVELKESNVKLDIVPAWNSGLTYNRTYSDPGSSGWGEYKDNSGGSGSYVINDSLSDIKGKDSIYLRHFGYPSGDNANHGAAIHMVSGGGSSGDSLDLKASGDIRIDAIASGSGNAFSGGEQGMYDAIQVYGTKNVELYSQSGDIIIYANNNGIDNTNSGGGDVELHAYSGSNYIHAGIDRVKNDTEGDAVRTQGSGSILIHAYEKNVLTANDVGVYVHKDTQNAGVFSTNSTSGSGYNILIEADGNNISGGFANTIVAGTGVWIDSEKGGDSGTSANVRVGVIANNGSNYIEGLKNYDNEKQGYGVSAEYGTIEVIAQNGANYLGGVIGVSAEQGKVEIISSSGNYIFATAAVSDGNNYENSAGIQVSGSGAVVNITSSGNNIIGAAFADDANSTCITEQNKTVPVLFKEAVVMTGGTLTLTSTGGVNVLYAKENGIHLKESGNNYTSASESHEIHVLSGDAVLTDEDASGSLTITATKDYNLFEAESASGHAISTVSGSAVEIKISASGSGNYFYAGGTAIDHQGSGKIEITAENGTNLVVGGYDFKSNSIAISSKDMSGIDVGNNGSVTLTGATNQVFGVKNGINLTAGQVSLNASGENSIFANDFGIHISDKLNECERNTTSSNAYSVTLSGSANTIVSFGDDGASAADGINLADNSTGSVSLTASSGNNTIVAYAVKNTATKSNGSTVAKGGDGILTKDGSTGNVTLTAQQGDNQIIAGNNGIDSRGSQKITLTAQNGSNQVFGAYFYDDEEGGVEPTGDGIRIEGDGSIYLEAGKSNLVVGHDAGINITKSGASTQSMIAQYTGETDKDVTLIAASNVVSGEVSGITAKNGSASIKATGNAQSGNNTIQGVEKYGVDAANAQITVIAQSGSNFVLSHSSGIKAADGSEIKFSAGSSNYVQAATDESGSGAVFAKGQSSVEFASQGSNLILAGSDKNNSLAVNAAGGSTVALKAEVQNYLQGAVYASGSGTSVSFTGLNGGSGADVNYVRSNAVITDAGDLSSNGDEAQKSLQVRSALYAEGGAVISLSGDENYITTFADPNATDLERTIWAYDQGKISIDGAVYISTDAYEQNTDSSANSKDVAIAAGTAVGLNSGDVAKFDPEDEEAELAIVDIDYSNAKNGAHSSITGDILAAYEGMVNIDAKDETSGIDINGNLLAGNKGVLNVNLGSGGSLTGRIDDYGDAGSSSAHHEALEFFNPLFSSDIYQGGSVNLTMGQDSVWYVTGQSWVTQINAPENEDITNSTPLIVLTSGKTDLNTNAHALTINELNGNLRFNMKLDSDRSVSDMLYIKQANGGEYWINIDPVTVEDMYSDDEGNSYTGLRFATVGVGSTATFRVFSLDTGSALNIVYLVDQDSYDTSSENTAYNGAEVSESKPGDSLVDGFFAANADTPSVNGDDAGSSTDTQDGVAVYSEVDTSTNPPAEEESEQDNIADTIKDKNYNNSVDNAKETTNFKLVGVERSEISDAGKTMIDMSRANYAAAVYMDTLNKRLGEARFVGNEDGGFWVRLRHDNIGKEHSFRNHSTMFEMGIDRRDKMDTGEWHSGFALDYMKGDIDYHNAHGDGDLERCGIWLYTTWLADDGQYLDLVFKYAHLRNDFDVRLDSGVGVDGDYSNDVFSLSAEYGWKFANSYNYFIEPQVQLQYSYVTSADYTTSFGTEVDLDAINSLIGRAGFRAGKDFLDQDHPVSLYLRADVMREFLGDQDITAKDASGVMDVTYENDDTWYSVGLGISVQKSENTYFFLEGEQLFGADHDSSYIFTGGFKHSF